MSTEQFQMTVSDISVDVVKKDIKNIHLAVYPPTGRVRLSSPHSMRAESLRLFVISKIGWIRKHIRNMNSQIREPEREYIQGESHWVQGQRYLLNIIEEEKPPKVEIRNKKYLDLYVRPGSDKAKREEVIKKWYRELLKSQIPSLIEKWEEKLEVEIADWGVRQMKTKWGSCNVDDRRIWLNLELAKKPKHCLDYVVLHEMVHQKERHHNDRFKELLDNYMPSWRQRREELNEVVY
ncbi:M48 family peptidase [Rhodohalobacter sp. SW132]|uniref:M48 family metallopeptidase n=1 Tax=Rhodohalobacter sp. SW132 TaxID=2293433 RepID=UPI000E224354|nr:SprT family zinc-dependent metalloprotease [Rhodohalobacter sp. SW132]REL32991.1 M48 family peptidase [Rhodohalobacter sp. SW132]